MVSALYYLLITAFNRPPPIIIHLEQTKCDNPQNEQYLLITWFCTDLFSHEAHFDLKIIIRFYHEAITRILWSRKYNV